MIYDVFCFFFHFRTQINDNLNRANINTYLESSTHSLYSWATPFGLQSDFLVSQYCKKQAHDNIGGIVSWSVFHM